MTFNPNSDIGGGKVSKRGRNTGIAVGGGLGVIALFVLSQFLGVDLTGQPQPGGPRTHPHPGRLLGARVVLLQPSSDRVQVVLLLARPQPTQVEKPTTVQEPVAEPPANPVVPEQPADEPTTSPTDGTTDAS